MIVIRIPTDSKPHNWVPARVCKKITYNPKHKEKEFTRWIIKGAYPDEPISGCFHVTFFFYFPIPKGTSKAKKAQMLSHKILPDVTPDLTNMQKFYEDCLKGIVIPDDRYITDISSRKRYSEKPGVVIQIKKLNDECYHIEDEGFCV